MSKHTRGPYAFDRGMFNSYGGLIISMDNSIDGRPQRIDLSIPIEDEMGEDAYEEQIANAHLLAAAPELLEAIKAMLPWFCPNEDASDCEIRTLDVLDLIARAEGKE